MDRFSIVTIDAYLDQIGTQRLVQFGLCHIFFNSKYLDYFDSSQYSLVVEYKGFSVYSLCLDVKKSIHIAFIRNGASLSAIDFECLIHLGFNEFIIWGFCCSIGECNIGDLVIVNKAYIGEGVSKYYDKDVEFANPSIELNQRILDCLKPKRTIIPVSCFSTEALFMETERLIINLKNQNIDCIDMECSALASIAEYRNVKMSCLFSVSDTIRLCQWNRANDIDLRRILIDSLFCLYSED